MGNKKLTFGAVLIGVLIFSSAVTILTIFPPENERVVREKEKVYVTNHETEKLLRAYQIQLIDSTLVLYDRYRYVGEVNLSKTENASLDSLILSDNE